MSKEAVRNYFLEKLNTPILDRLELKPIGCKLIYNYYCQSQETILFKLINAAISRRYVSPQEYIKIASKHSISLDWQSMFFLRKLNQKLIKSDQIIYDADFTKNFYDEIYTILDASKAINMALDALLIYEADLIKAADMINAANNI